LSNTTLCVYLLYVLLFYGKLSFNNLNLSIAHKPLYSLCSTCYITAYTNSKGWHYKRS